MTNDSQPKPEPIDTNPLKGIPLANPPWIPDPTDLENLRLEFNTALSTDARLEFDPSAAAHEKLSKFVYDMARRIEARNMAEDTVILEEDANFLEELLAMIAVAPLSPEYAMKMAFAKPADSARGVGPHKLYHEPSGEWVWCGGPGLCRWCTEGGQA